MRREQPARQTTVAANAAAEVPTPRERRPGGPEQAQRTAWLVQPHSGTDRVRRRRLRFGRLYIVRGCVRLPRVIAVRSTGQVHGQVHGQVRSMVMQHAGQWVSTD